jgi:molecular chaperone GrpE
MLGQQKQDDSKKDPVQNSVAADDKDKKIIELEAKVKELDNNWRRALADYQNLTKRSQEEMVNAVRYGCQNVIFKFLEILDHLEEAQKHLKDKGLELIIAQFKIVFKSEGIVEIEALNKNFDPVYHECLEMRPARLPARQGDKDNVIIEVARRGYLFKDKVLRPAKVVVEVKQK